MEHTWGKLYIAYFAARVPTISGYSQVPFNHGILRFSCTFSNNISTITYKLRMNSFDMYVCTNYCDKTTLESEPGMNHI